MPKLSLIGTYDSLPTQHRSLTKHWAETNLSTKPFIDELKIKIYYQEAFSHSGSLNYIDF